MIKGILFTVICTLLTVMHPGSSAAGIGERLSAWQKPDAAYTALIREVRQFHSVNIAASMAVSQTPTHHFQQGGNYSRSTGIASEGSLLPWILVSMAFCLALCQLLMVSSASGEHRSLTLLVFVAFVYECIRLAPELLPVIHGSPALTRLALPAELVLLTAASRFIIAFFDLKATHPRLFEAFTAACALLILMVPLSLLSGIYARTAGDFIYVLWLALLAVTIALVARTGEQTSRRFLIASVPVALGVLGEMGVHYDLLSSAGPYRYFLDMGLQATLAVFIYQVTRRQADHQRSREATLKETQRRYQLALEGSNDGIFEWDMPARKVLASRRAHEIVDMDFTPDWQPQSRWRELIPTPELERFTHMPESFVMDEDVVRVETWIVDRHGNRRFLLVQGKLDHDESGTPVSLIGSISDITAQKRLEERLRHDALHDFLTGLPNRTLLTDRIARVIKRLKRNPESRAALLFIGLDNFKSVNDNLGHGFGDQVLISVANRLVEFVRSSDTVARFGGDEFVILLEDMFSHREAERFANRMLAKVQSPLEIQHQHLVPSVSIGMTIVEDPNMSAEMVLGDADIAMYAAKENGKGRVVAFETTMRTRAAKRLELESALHNALENEELYLTYQPIFSIEDNEPRAVGVEALLRWRQSDRDNSAPSELISLAEENGTIEEIGKWVIREAAHQLARWRAIGYPDEFYININLSAVHFESDEIVATILKEVDPLGLPRNALRIEIVETAVVRYPEKALSVIKLLQSQGILVSIDDFGTGFSSLSYLHRFPFHALKIDRSFVSEIVESRATRDIVTAIVVLGRRLGIKVVAEGIENTAQLEFLKSVGCQLGQGYLLAKPSASAHHLFIRQTAEATAGESATDEANVRESAIPTAIAPQYP